MIQNAIPSYSSTIHKWAWWEDGFTSSELDTLQQKAKNARNVGVVGGKGVKGQADFDARRCEVDWVFNSPENEWLFTRLSDITAKLNADYFHFDLTGFEPLQLTNYTHQVSGMYGWHVDYGTTISRKLSVVLQLSDPSEYKGGELQIAAGEHINVPKQRGLVVAFPSFSLHQVTPVTSGTRQTLVGWASGPSFR